MKTGLIYCYVNKINGKCYVGQTINENARKIKHLSEAKLGKTKYPFHCAIRKYGIDNFEYSVVENCSVELLDEREQHWIKYFDSNTKGYNCNDGGGGNRGFKWTDEQKEQIRLRNSGVNNPNYGKT